MFTSSTPDRATTTVRPETSTALPEVATASATASPTDSPDFSSERNRARMNSA